MLLVSCNSPPPPHPIRGKTVFGKPKYFILRMWNLNSSHSNLIVTLYKVCSVVNNCIFQMKKLSLEEVNDWSQATIRCQRNVCTVQSPD